MTDNAQEFDRLKVAALFAGIGGVEKGLRRTGAFQPTFFSEIDAGACEVLKAQFKGIPNLGNIEDLGSLEEVGPVELVTAGFPCQDLSQAGRTAGITGPQSGLASKLLELLGRAEGRIPWVLIENVPFMLQLNRGAAMDFLTAGLEDAGYRWAYRVIDTRAMGIPQRRRRVFLLASSKVLPEKYLLTGEQDPCPVSEEPKAYGFYWTEGTRGLGWAEDSIPTLKGGSGLGIPSPPAIWIPGKGVFTPTLSDAEVLQGFPPGWTEPATRAQGVSDRNRWKLLGNAVTVDVAEWVGQQLLEEPRPVDMSRSFEIAPGGPWPIAGFGGDGRRFGYQISEWPIAKSALSLLEVVRTSDLNPLSLRATTSFLSRYVRGTLRKKPDFIRGLCNHVSSLEGMLDDEIKSEISDVLAEPVAQSLY